MVHGRFFAEHHTAVRRNMTAQLEAVAMLEDISL